MNQDHIQAGQILGLLPDRVLLSAVACVLTVLMQGACSSISMKGGYTDAGRKGPITATDSCNPVIFIHGTMGSRLVDEATGRIVWGDFSRDGANGSDPEAVRGVALCMERGKPLEQLVDSTKPVGYLDSINLTLLGALKLNVPIYGDTAKRFGDICSDDDGRSGACGRRLDFHYDWRRSYDENARLFARFISDKKRELVEEHGFAADMKFNIVAHSQGGLMFKYFLRYGDAGLPADGSLPELTWAGAPYVDKVVYIGIPNGGVVPTLDFLTNGHQAKAVMPKYEAAVVGTMPAIYQMIPRAADGVLLEPGTDRALDPLDYDLWVRKEWGLANPEQDEVLQVLLPEVSSREERRAIALDHLRKCLAKARQVQAALDRPCVPPASIETVICVGTTEDTMAGFHATQRHIKLARTEKGDGTVTIQHTIKGKGPREDAFFFKGDHLRIVTSQEVNQRIASIFEARRSVARDRVREPVAPMAGLLASFP